MASKKRKLTDIVQSRKISSFDQLIDTPRYLEHFLADVDDSDQNNVKFKNSILTQKNLLQSHTRGEKKLSNEKELFRGLCHLAVEKIEKRYFGEGSPGKSTCVCMAQKLDTAMFLQSEEFLEHYGDGELEEMCQLFGFPKERTLSEWKMLRSIMFNNNWKSTISLETLLGKMSSPQFQKFQMMKGLIEVLLTIPPSNAEVERVWSNVKNIINDRSTSMKKDMLTNRIIIKNAKISLNNFNPEDSVQLWWQDSIRYRRPCFKD